MIYGNQLLMGGHYSPLHCVSQFYHCSDLSNTKDFEAILGSVALSPIAYAVCLKHLKLFEAFSQGVAQLSQNFVLLCSSCLTIC